MDSLIDELANSEISESIGVKQSFLSDPHRMTLLSKVAQLCIDTYRAGNKILIAGNGGSAADAQHFAGELVSRFNYDRAALSALALTTDTSVLTAIGNDYGYEEVFARQILANGKEGDLFIAISTSGNSPNILKAIDAARKNYLTVVGLTGDDGGYMKNACDTCVRVPSNSTPRIQESHLLIEHVICNVIERTLFPSYDSL